MNGEHPKNKALAIGRLERRRQAIELAGQGLYLEEIGERLGVSYETVRRDLNAGVLLAQADLKPVANQFVVEQIDLLMGIIDGLKPKALEGNLGAIEAIRKCGQEVGSLLGAYPKEGSAPQQAPSIIINVPIQANISAGQTATSAPMVIEATAHAMPVGIDIVDAVELRDCGD